MSNWQNLHLHFPGVSDDIGNIKDVKVIPDPPQKGADLTVEAEVDLSELFML